MKIGAEQARRTLPELLARAHAGERLIITKHGAAYAELGPVPAQEDSIGGAGILALRGTGRGIWGDRASAWVADLRDEWP